VCLDFHHVAPCMHDECEQSCTIVEVLHLRHIWSASNRCPLRSISLLSIRETHFSTASPTPWGVNMGPHIQVFPNLVEVARKASQATLKIHFTCSTSKHGGHVFHSTWKRFLNRPEDLYRNVYQDAEQTQEGPSISRTKYNPKMSSWKRPRKRVLAVGVGSFRRCSISWTECTALYVRTRTKSSITHMSCLVFVCQFLSCMQKKECTSWQGLSVKIHTPSGAGDHDTWQHRNLRGNRKVGQSPITKEMTRQKDAIWI